jgi:hypothetical protein
MSKTTDLLMEKVANQDYLLGKLDKASSDATIVATVKDLKKLGYDFRTAVSDNDLELMAQDTTTL